MLKLYRPQRLLTFVFFIIFITGAFTSVFPQWEGWNYRRTVTINNTSGSTLTDYQVKIDLSNLTPPFIFGNANSDGSDVRITSDDGVTEIPFWIEEWDFPTLRATIWVKVPDIPTPGGATVYLYYGNATATSTSSGSNTFSLFDDDWDIPITTLNPVQVATQPWWEVSVSYPIVFEDNSFTGRDRFHMLYDGHFAIGHAKGYSTSPDLVTWTAYDNGLTGNSRINPIMGVGYVGNAQFAWGDIIKVGSVFHMYPSQGPGTTVHCQSTDLIHWTGSAGGGFDALSSTDPSGIGTGVAILKEADGKTPIIVDNKYWMVYFHGFSGGSMYLAYAETSDLLTWTMTNSGSPILVPSGWEGSQLWTPSFVGINDTYYIYYQGGSPYRIGFASAPATSGGNPVRPDNTTWTKSPNNPVITNTHGWDNGFCQDPTLRYFDGTYYCFYTGDPPWTNGFAYSDSPEGPWIQYGASSGGSGVNWSRGGNPTVSSGIISFTSPPSYIQSPDTYSQGNALGYRANYKGGSSAFKWAGFINAVNPPFTLIGVSSDVGTNLLLHNYTAGPRRWTSLGVVTDAFNIYELAWLASGTRAYINHSSTPDGTVTLDVPPGPLPVSFRNHTDNTYGLQVDWMYVRKFNDPEPTIEMGEEEANPLPVELNSFSASVVGTKVNLRWMTETEVNNYGFEIERASSSPVQGWTKIGFVEGNGNSNSPKYYSFEDNNLTAGKYSYRLKQIDTDGQFEYSKAIEIEFGVPGEYALSQNNPNPFNPTTRIVYQLPEKGNVTLKVFDMLGKEIATLVEDYRDEGRYEVEFNASNFSSGAYFYRIQSGDFVETKKMILMK